MAGGVTYDEGTTIILDSSIDTQPMDINPLSPCGKVLQSNLIMEVDSLITTTTTSSTTITNP